MRLKRVLRTLLEGMGNGKLTAREVGLHLDEHNQLEYELRGDELDREHWDWDEPFDDYDYGYDPYDPYPMDDIYDY
jgi:hypothetical protein